MFWQALLCVSSALAESDSNYTLVDWTTGVIVGDGHPVIDTVTDLAKTAFSCGIAVEDPAELPDCLEDIVEFVINALKALIDAFTHSRVIHVRISMTRASPLKLINTYESGRLGDGGSDTAWDQSAKDGVHLMFHNDGGIGGCQVLQHTGWCQNALVVCVSNPLIGGNKARVAYLDNLDGLNLHDFYEAMESWGEVVTTDNMQLLQEFNHYDNPSSIAFSAEIPEACQVPVPTPPAPTPSPHPMPVPVPTPSSCMHVHATANKRWTDPAIDSYFPVDPKGSEKACSMSTCGCRCREFCEAFFCNYWSINPRPAPYHNQTATPGSWQCYCFPGKTGTPTLASDADSQRWYSGYTKHAPRMVLV